MRFTAQDIAQQAAETRFPAETLEKVFRLLDLLSGIVRHPFLGSRVALKGGTALNLFMFDVPRLSVDVDLNYIGSLERAEMLSDVPKMRQAIHAVCGREGIVVKRVPEDHAGGKWRLSYNRTTGSTGTLELDINFMLRAPLWPIRQCNSKTLGVAQAINIPILDEHELAAGKLVAMIARNASRDLFDARALLTHNNLDRAKLRLGFVVYGGMSRIDWRTVATKDVTVDVRNVERELIPMLRADFAPAKAGIANWTAELGNDCRRLMSSVLPLSENELEFLDQLNDFGEIKPELLTDDQQLCQTLLNHPQLNWKALNVRQHRRKTPQ